MTNKNDYEKILIPKDKINTINKAVNLQFNKELKESDSDKFPPYSSSIFNLISQTGHATRPSNVGAMSEIVPKFIEEFVEKEHKNPNAKDWSDYYLKNYIEEYNKGLEILKRFVDSYKELFQKIIDDEDHELAKAWYDKFLLQQNFMGFQYEITVFKFLTTYKRFAKNPFVVRKSTTAEESKNIDIVIENKEAEFEDFKELWINVKPKSTYKFKADSMPFNFDNRIIVMLYSLTDKGVEIEFATEEHEKRFHEFEEYSE